MRLARVCLILAATLTGCFGPEDPVLSVSDLPATVSLRRGQAATIGGVKVRFESVLSNSLCPRDVQCVWSGSVQLQLVVGPTAGDGPAFRLVLNTHTDPRTGFALGFWFTIERLLEAPVSGALDGSYKIRLRIEPAIVAAAR